MYLPRGETGQRWAGEQTQRERAWNLDVQTTDLVLRVSAALAALKRCQSQCVA